jgi:hypothetical protein
MAAPTVRLRPAPGSGSPTTMPSSWGGKAWAGWEGLQADVRVVLPSWLAARVFVTLGYLLAVAVADHWVAGGRTTQMSEGLLAWDGTFYRDIASGGYGTLPVDSLRFFPLYPLLGRGLAPFLFGHTGLALIVIANVASLAVAVVIRRMVLFEKDDEAMAERAVWLTALFPSAFVLAWAYAEGLFLLTCVGAILAARSRRFEVAAVLALLAALTRPTGVLLAAPLAIEGVRAWRESSATDRVATVLAVLAPVTGLVLYLSWVGQHFGDARLPFSVQNSLRGEVVDPISRLARGFSDLAGAERFGDGLHVPFVIAFAALLVVVFRRWPVSYGVFALLIVVAAISADNLNSLERYGLNAFPLVLGLASVTTHPRVERLALAACGAGLVSLTALAWLAVYVP